MSSRIPDRNIWIIYAAILVLGIAYGMSISVLPIHLKAHGIPELAMGGLASAFAVGIFSLSMPAGTIVERFGAKRTLFLSLAGYAACVTTFPFLTTLTALTIARFLDGAFSVGIWVSAETALLARADKNNKALVMSLYAMSIAIGYVVGPIIAKFVEAAAGTRPAFLTSGVFALAAAAVILVVFREGGTAAESGHAGTGAPASPLFAIFWKTKTSCLATFSYGYFQASVVLFLPLFLIESKHVPKGHTILVTAFFAAGMLLSSTFVGRLGDRFGHLIVMTSLGAIGMTMVASFVFLSAFEAMCVAVFVAGASLGSISPLSLALQGVVLPTGDLGRANAFYNAAYGIGMLVGPPISGLLFTKYGGGEMLFHLAALWALFVGFTIVFAHDDPRRRARHQAHAERHTASSTP